MLLHIGPLEASLLLVVILSVLGAGKLPQVRGLIGKGLHAFRKGQSGEEDEEEPTKPKRKATKRTATGRIKQSESY